MNIYWTRNRQAAGSVLLFVLFFDEQTLRISSTRTNKFRGLGQNRSPAPSNFQTPRTTTHILVCGRLGNLMWFDMICCDQTTFVSAILAWWNIAALSATVPSGTLWTCRHSYHWRRPRLTFRSAQHESSFLWGRLNMIHCFCGVSNHLLAKSRCQLFVAIDIANSIYQHTNYAFVCFD